MKYLKTTEKATVTDYPYGRLRTTAIFSLEFKPGKGFRSIFQTVNPKTGKLNAEKKGTYSPVIVLTEDGKGYIGHKHLSFNGAEEINKGCKFMAENFLLFTEEQIKDIYAYIVGMLKAEARATVIYCGADASNVLEVLKPATKAAVEGFKTGANLFPLIEINEIALKETHVKDYNPFTVKEYTTA